MVAKGYVNHGKGGFDGKQYMRIAVRNHEDNTKLIEALKKLEQ